MRFRVRLFANPNDLYDVLSEKGMHNLGVNFIDPYMQFINHGSAVGFFSFKETKGKSFVNFKPEWLDELKLLPKEAIYTHLEEYYVRELHTTKS